MAGFLNEPKVDVVASSGMLRVTVCPRLHWLTTIVELVVAVFLASILYHNWTHISLTMRVICLWAIVSTVPFLLYQHFGEEIIEFDAQKLTIRKGVHGWERKREYQLEECRELEWESDGEGKPAALKCKVGWRSITFGKYLSEDNANEILTALQRNLPDVAQKICSYPGGKEHFLTLGLGRK